MSITIPFLLFITDTVQWICVLLCTLWSLFFIDQNAGNSYSAGPSPAVLAFVKCFSNTYRCTIYKVILLIANHLMCIDIFYTSELDPSDFQDLEKDVIFHKFLSL